MKLKRLLSLATAAVLTAAPGFNALAQPLPLPDVPAPPAQAPGPGPEAPDVSGRSVPEDVPGGLPPSIGPAAVAIRPPVALYRPANEIVPAGMVQLHNTPIEQVLLLNYPEYSGRTVLRPTSLPAATISFQNHTDMTVAEIVDALDAVLAMNGVTMIPFGEKFVRAVPNQQAKQEGAEVHSAASHQIPMSDQFITQMVRLKVLRPSEVAPLFATFSRNAATAITPVDSSQMLIISDTAANVRRMMELIERIDVEPEAEYILKVIPIRYGMVDVLYETMNSLISGTGPTGAAGGVRTTPAGGARATGPGGRATTTPATTRPAMGTTVRPMDAEVVPLQVGAPAPATDRTAFQQQLQRIVSRVAAGDPVQVLGDARIVPDLRSNSLLVYANRRDLAMIERIVNEVDRLMPQVLVEAIIMEVRRSDGQTVAVSMQQNPTRAGDLLSGGGIANTPASLTAGRAFLDSAGTNALGQGFSYFGRLGSTMEVAISAIANDSSVDVLSRPRIQTSHAVPAYFLIGESIPYITGTTDFGFDARSVRSQVQEREIVFRLDVTPFITPDGLVVMDIMQTFDTRGDTVIEIDGNAIPAINRREVASNLSIQDGDTIILGGFITQNKTLTKSGVPYLKDIPVLGALFRSKIDSNQRSELIVLLRVTVLSTPQMAAIVAEEERMRLPGITQAEIEMEKDRQERVRRAEDALRQYEYQRGEPFQFQ